MDEAELVNDQLKRIAGEVAQLKQTGRGYAGGGFLLALGGVIWLMAYDWKIGIGAAAITGGLYLISVGHMKQLVGYVMNRDALVLNVHYEGTQRLLAQLPGIIQQYAPAAVATMFNRRSGPLS